MSLKKWCDNRVKNEKLLDTLHTGNEKLAESIHMIENDNLNLIGKIQSISMGYERILRDYLKGFILLKLTIKFC